jgi:hypothetical protein
MLPLQQDSDARRRLEPAWRMAGTKPFRRIKQRLLPCQACKATTPLDQGVLGRGMRRRGGVVAEE